MRAIHTCMSFLDLSDYENGVLATVHGGSFFAVLSLLCNVSELNSARNQSCLQSLARDLLLAEMCSLTDNRSHPLYTPRAYLYEARGKIQHLESICQRDAGLIQTGLFCLAV
jgi:hypothetical protein